MIQKGMVIDMREQIKKKFKKRRYAVLLSLMAGVLLFLLRGQFSHAADQIFIKFNEAKLDPAVTYDMTTSTMQLMLGTPDVSTMMSVIRSSGRLRIPRRVTSLLPLVRVLRKTLVL